MTSKIQSQTSNIKYGETPLYIYLLSKSCYIPLLLVPRLLKIQTPSVFQIKLIESKRKWIREIICESGENPDGKGIHLKCNPGADNELVHINTAYLFVTNAMQKEKDEPMK